MHINSASLTIPHYVSIWNISILFNTTTTTTTTTIINSIISCIIEVWY